MDKKVEHEGQASRQQDEKVFRGGDAIFSQEDLRELINNIYSQYKYKRTHSDKLVKLINFLALESNRYIEPELADQSKRLSAYLDTFCDFIKSNFHEGEKTEDDDIIYLFNTEETSSETEAFLIEFQMVSLDVEKAYKKYRATAISILQI